MIIHRGERRVRLSVREFAEFRIGGSSHSGSFASPWRTALGTAWHQSLQEKAPEGARFEVPLKATLILRDWRVELQGRIDQVYESDGKTILREIKTVSKALPLAPEEILNEYPAYACQAALYQLLYPLVFDGATASAELFLVDIGSGFTQQIDLSSLAKPLVQEQFAHLFPFLESRSLSLAGWNEASIKPAFTTLRQGQAEAADSLNQESIRHQTLLFQAPTGFGKTGIALDFGLNGMRSGRYDRIVYLTGKSTGQVQTLQQLSYMLSDPQAPRFYQMRGRVEHTQSCPLPFCKVDGTCEVPQTEAAPNFSELLQNEPDSMAQALRLSEQLRLCPYELSRAALAYADIWVGDYNYLFSPHNRSVFLEQPGFDPARTLLIIDEAHNLPARVEGACSAQTSYEAADHALQALRFAGAPGSLLLAWQRWADFLETLRKCQRIDLTDEYEAIDLIESLAQELAKAPLEIDLLSQIAVAEIRNFYQLRYAAQSDTIETFFYAPQKGTLVLQCLNAAQEIAASIQPFAQTLLMSATLEPLDLFTAAIEQESVGFVQGQAAWRDGAYKVAIDQRVDTRMKARLHSYALTAQTINDLRMNSATAVAAFFSSYDYAEKVAAYLQAQEAPLRVVIQPRGVGLGEQRRFIEESLLTQDVLCLVLGSGFSEGIDLLGGRIETAIVVGPALPEVNAVQQARMEAVAHLGRNEAFRRVYLVPALSKVNQALGRLVRAPGHKATVLLHGKRFSEPDLYNLLMADYQGGTMIQSREDLHGWLE